MVEYWIVIPGVVGSSPIIHPIAPVVQLNRASGFEPEGRRFESVRAHSYYR